MNIPKHIADRIAREAAAGVVQRAFTVTKGEGGTTKVVASTADVDRMDDIIDQTTWNLANFEANPVILWMHDPYSHAPIGRATASIEGGALVAEITWDVGDPLGADVARKFAEGFLHAVSVGFRPGRSVARKALDPSHPWFKADGWGYVYYDCDLLEISAVGIPANPKATTSKNDGAGGDDRVAALEARVLELTDLVRALVVKQGEMAAMLTEVRAMVEIGGDDAPAGGNDDDDDTGGDAAIKAVVAALRESRLLA